MGKLVGFHDIGNPRLGTYLFWQELKAICPTKERIEQATRIMGIGLV